MLCRLAVEHADPATEAWQREAGGGQPYYNGDIFTNGINTTRGRAAEAIRKLVHTDAAYVDRFRATLRRMVRDPSAAVLSCVAGALRAVAVHDAALGMALFKNMRLSEERLLATYHMDHFARERLRDTFADVRPIIMRMLRSSEPDVQNTGARLACFAVLQHGGPAAPLVDKAMAGGRGHRLGVARVAAANCAVPSYRVWCGKVLAKLFDDDAAEVRREAASCFRHLADDALDASAELIESFCRSRALRR